MKEQQIKDLGLLKGDSSLALSKLKEDVKVEVIHIKE
jgi:hypothetical protein